MEIEKVISNVRDQISYLKNLEGTMYQEIYKDINPESIKNLEDFRKIPFTRKSDLRNYYPLGIMARPEEEIVRIHSSSGTTGTPVIIPYTQKDIDDWTDMFARCYRTAGVTNKDRVQIAVGYGLWTAGASFQRGAEKVGAMAIPMGPGNSEKQVNMMIDMESTVLCATSSYALLLAEKIKEFGLNEKIKLRKGIIGSEQWGPKMKERIARELNSDLYDIYGLTEIYGPGVGISCHRQDGIHIWEDYFYIEVIDSETGEVLPDGEYGELVITTLTKEGAPLLRYRTHDITRIIPGDCPCGLKHNRIDTLKGRTDDMFKVKGVNMFPKQVEEVLSEVEGVSSEYRVMIDHLDGKDILTLYFECDSGVNCRFVEQQVGERFKIKIGISIFPKAVQIGDLPRSENKTSRIYDNRY